jgi:Glycosyltransferase Family 4
MCVSTLSVSVAVDEEPVSECCCFSPNKCGVPIDDRKDSTNTWKQGVEVTSSTMTGCVSSDDDEDGHDNDNDRENEDEDEDSDDVEDTYRDTDIDTTNDSLLTLSPNVNVTITKCLVDGSDYNQQSDSIIDSDPMKICYVIEPSPLTYFSGYASVYQSLFKHALNNQTQDELQLVTTECHVPQPVTWCPDADAAAVTTTRAATPASVSILDHDTDHCCERESLTSCSRNTSCSSSNSISSTLSSNTSNSSCCSREMPVYHAFGLPVVTYPSATVSFDCTMLLWRILWRCRPDIVHSTTPSSFNFPTILYCRLLRIPLLLSYHTHIPLLPEYYLKKDEWEQSKSSFRHAVLALIILAKAVGKSKIRLGLYILVHCIVY